MVPDEKNFHVYVVDEKNQWLLNPSSLKNKGAVENDITALSKSFGALWADMARLAPAARAGARTWPLADSRMLLRAVAEAQAEFVDKLRTLAITAGPACANKGALLCCGHLADDARRLQGHRTVPCG